MTAATESAPSPVRLPGSGPGALADRVPTWALGLGLVLLHLAVTLQVRPNPRWNDGIFVLDDAATFPDARVELVRDSRTFVMIDQPDRLAELVADFAPVNA